MVGPFCYVGGKNRLAAKIISEFPEHKTYVEPFAGGAQVFFRKEPSEVEVLNDLNAEIPNFFRVCQNHYEELIRYTRFFITSRTWFALLEQTSPESLTDVQRAGRFLYLQKHAYAGLVVRRNYKAHVANAPNFNASRLSEIIEAAHKRLARVQIECLPYQQILEKFDRPSTLFYMDPPYYGRRLYRANLEHKDFVELARRVRDLRGKVLLSLNDVQEVRSIFSEFRLESVRLAYSAQKNAGNLYSELIIRNW